MKTKKVHSVGKRKKAVARAFCEPGNEEVRINSRPLSIIKSELCKLMLQEPLKLAGKLAKEVKIDVTTKGGGVIGQTEAARQAIARALLKFSSDKELAKRFELYDPYLLEQDARRTEPHKPPLSSKGARKHKQRAKR